MRCCYRCNPDLVLPFVASDKHDSRLSAFTNDFTFGAVVSRPGSSASTRTDVSNTSSFTPACHAVKVTKEDQERLCQRLIKWRDKKHEESGSPLFLSAQILFPSKQLNSFVTQCDKFLHETVITPPFLRKLVPRDSALESDLDQIITIINDWRESIAIVVPTTCYDFDRFRLYSRDRSQSVSDNAQAYVQGAS